MASPERNKYFAFISYKREDEEWAIWLQHELEYYHLPASLNGRDDLPKEFRPVFRDIDELKAGNLPQQIYGALASSLNLIVICSPRSAKSKWVNKEIDDFIGIGKKRGINNLDRVFPFIVEGAPHVKDETRECFPKILRDLPSDYERIGGNVNESGRDKAFIKVMAGMLPNVDFNMLWNRYERDKAEEERLKREEREHFLMIQSRLVAEKAITVSDQNSHLARLLAISVLPNDLRNPDRPYTPEAEYALRSACMFSSGIIRDDSINSYGSCLGIVQGMILYLSSNSVCFWNYFSGGFIKRMKLRGKPDFANVCSDGTLLVSVKGKNISVYDTTTGKLKHKLLGHKKAIRFVGFNNTFTQIVSLSCNEIIIWNTNTGKETSHFSSFSDNILYVKHSQDDKQLLIVSENGKIVVLDVDTQKKVDSFSIDGLSDETEYVLCNLDMKYIASVSYVDEKLRLWNLENKQEVIIKEQPFFVTSIAFSHNGLYLAVASYKDNTIRVLEVATGNNVNTLSGHADVIQNVFFSLDDSQLISSSWDGTIRIWDIFEDNEKHVLCGHKDGVTLALFSCEGKQIVSSSWDRSIKLWSVETEKEIYTLGVVPSGITSIALSNDEKTVLSFSRDKTIRIWDIGSSKELYKMDVVSPFVYSGVFVNNAKGVLFADYTQSLKVWNIETMEKREVLSLKESNIRNVCISPNQKLIAMGLYHGFLVLDRDKKEFVINCHTSNDITSIGINYNGERVVTAAKDGIISVWDVFTGKQVVNIYTPEGVINSVSFSPNGKQIASASEDHTVKVWDVQSGKLLQTFNGHTGSVSSVIFSPDGKRLLSASADGTIRIWDFPPLQDLIDQTRERFKDRPLTPEERRTYYLE